VSSAPRKTGIIKTHPLAAEDTVNAKENKNNN